MKADSDILWNLSNRIWIDLSAYSTVESRSAGRNKYSGREKYFIPRKSKFFGSFVTDIYKNFRNNPENRPERETTCRCVVINRPLGKKSTGIKKESSERVMLRFTHVKSIKCEAPADRARHGRDQSDPLSIERLESRHQCLSKQLNDG